jgi:hypothetical protein
LTFPLQTWWSQVPYKLVLQGQFSKIFALVAAFPQFYNNRKFDHFVKVYGHITIWNSSMQDHFVEGSLEVKLPTIWTDEKQSRAEAERRGRLEERRSEEKESGRKKMQMREKVGKSRNTVFFQ